MAKKILASSTYHQSSPFYEMQASATGTRDGEYMQWDSNYGSTARRITWDDSNSVDIVDDLGRIEELFGAGLPPSRFTADELAEADKRVADAWNKWIQQRRGDVWTPLSQDERIEEMNEKSNTYTLLNLFVINKATLEVEFLTRYIVTRSGERLAHVAELKLMRDEDCPDEIKDSLASHREKFYAVVIDEISSFVVEETE